MVGKGSKRGKAAIADVAIARTIPLKERMSLVDIGRGGM